ncbi:unnamed protein product [Rotaria sp. Silwood1]|nr:unnamed protein product [Rotaria sp. Silwood1]CAF1298668.1 unnamed protein product [Rotaria sp. Silwood1]CAF3545476.1 unnamed protein product [Rotaria sp. Silwood1]CAF4760751.1 unnamed protein product [Rotaria sp. Silwood1]
MSNLQLDSNDNMVNLYNKRLKDININDICNGTLRELTQWRDDCHKQIDEIYQRKSEELDIYIKKIKSTYEEKKINVQTNIHQLNEENKKNTENNDIIKTIIQSIEQDLNDIEQLSIKINTRLLTIDDSYVHIEKEFNFENLSSNYSKFNYSTTSSSALASNKEFLLMHQSPNLCLIDRDCKIVKQNVWPHDWIRDMCWSETWKCFIIITTNDIYCINEILEYSTSLIDVVKQVWFSCTCSNQSLYLSTCEWGSSIFQFNLLPSFTLIKQWEPPLTCEKDDGINDIKCNNETLALMINDSKTHQKRMELKSTETFDTIWLLHLSIGSDIRLFTCCLINYNEWLAVDGTNSHVYHISKDGKFKTNIKYPSTPYRANLLSSNILAISAEEHLNLYRFSI